MDRRYYFAIRLWKKLRVIYEGKIPVLEKGSSEIVVTSEFTGPASPKLGIEFKSVGKPENDQKNVIK